VRPWIGVDLDGTLAVYDKWEGPTIIGPPVPRMVERVLAWREEGWQVKIFTARVADAKERHEAHPAIEAWCREHLGEVLPITCEKDMGMVELWDDRCVQVRKNTGEPIGRSTRGLS